MLRKFSFILTKDGIKEIILISAGSLFLSFSEALGVGIIIPIFALFLSPEKIADYRILQHLYQFVNPINTTHFLSVLIAAAIIFFVLKSIYAVCMTYFQQRFIRQAYNRIAGRVLESYLNKPYAFHLENNSSILFKNVYTEVGQFISGFLTPVVLISSEIIVLLGIFLTLAFIYPFITFSLAAALLVVFATINIFLKNKIRKFSAVREKSSALIYKTALEGLHAVKEIKVYKAEKFFINNFSRANKEYSESLLKFNVISGFPRYMLESVMFISMLGVILLSIFLRKNPADLIPMMAAIGIAAMRFLPSISKIYVNINDFQYSLNSLDIVHEILKEDYLQNKHLLNTPADCCLPDQFRQITLKDLTFCYKTAAEPLFKGFSLVIPAGKTTAFVGETGAGKSTLIDILIGLLIPSKGTLYYGDSAITKENISEYRKNIGYVPQQIFLVDDTIQANIAFGMHDEKVDQQQLKYVIEVAQLDSFVKGLPNGAMTQVGERGVKLSGGQRQRIGIARALYHNPQILVLDEATSALDNHTEAELSAAIRNFKKGLTIIMVAHRLTTVEQADIIYLIGQGKIIEKGSFKELAQRSLVFQKIANQKFFSAEIKK